MKKNSQSQGRPVKPRHYRSLDEWQALVDEYESGNMRKTAFCRKHKVAVSNFSKWYEKLGKANLASSSLSSKLAFIELEKPKVEGIKNRRWDMELVLPGGAVLKIREARCHD